VAELPERPPGRLDVGHRLRLDTMQQQDPGEHVETGSPRKQPMANSIRSVGVDSASNSCTHWPRVGGSPWITCSASYQPESVANNVSSAALCLLYSVAVGQDDR
jgi:hypothetical protein